MTGHGVGALTARYQVGGLNTWCTQRLIKGIILPQLTYGIEVWANKGALKEVAKTLHLIIRNAFMIKKKTPILAIETELGIPPLDLYVKQRQDMLALRANHLNRHTRMSNSWLETSNLTTIIDNSQGAKEIKANMRPEWKERIDHEDIRYKGHLAKQYSHLKKLSRFTFKDILYLRATSGWPYQARDGKRRKCPCGRDIIPPAHLMRFCVIIPATKLELHNNKMIDALGEWVNSSRDSLKDAEVRKSDRAIHKVQVAGASINLPTSQPVGQNREWRNVRWYIQCQQCPKMLENTKREKAKHENTHRPKTGGS